ncbi:hypothetical protein [Aliidiomarina sp.]|uniref:hypothetical protein n=1 Tax=Aliidiomarina sp. TaxID=1872439 RepID=UPI003A4E3FDB
MPEALLIWIVLASFVFGLLCGLVIAYVRGLMHRNMFTFSPFNRHIRVLRRDAKAASVAGSAGGTRAATIDDANANAEKSRT